MTGLVERTMPSGVVPIAFTLVTLAGLTLSAPVSAGGYQLRQHSGAGLGAAIAGSTSGAHGLSSMFWNPAAAGDVEDSAASLGLSYIAPVSEVAQARAATATGTDVGGRRNLDDATPDAVIPALYLAAPLSQRVNLGLAVNAPFGLETSYDPRWVGRYQALDTQVATVNINPVVTYRPTDGVTLGAGVQAQYFHGELSNAIDFGTLGALNSVPGAVPAQQDGAVKLEADDWAVGFNLGALIEPWAGTRLGVGYRSQINHNLSGDADFRLDEAGVGAALSAATGAFTDTGAEAGISTPATLSLGLAQEVGPKLTLLAEAQWTDWSVFDDLVVGFDNPAQSDDVTEHDWKDGWFAALGARYSFDDTWTVRTGVAFDRSPVPDSTRTPRIPDADRYWLAAGVSYTPTSWITVDLGYTHLFMPEERFELRSSQPGSLLRGDLDAKTDTDVDIVSLFVNLRF